MSESGYAGFQDDQDEKIQIIKSNPGHSQILSIPIQIN